jgi:hypothetical protein
VGCVIVPIDHTIFHNEEDSFRVVNVLERIARHGNYISDFAGIESAYFLRQTEQVRGTRRARFQRLRRREAIRAHQTELTRIIAVRIHGSVCAQGRS